MTHDLNGVLSAGEMVKLRKLLASVEVGGSVVGGDREVRVVNSSFDLLSDHVLENRVGHDSGGSSSATSSWSEMVEEDLAAGAVDTKVAGDLVGEGREAGVLGGGRDVSVEKARVTGFPVASEQVKSLITFGGFGSSLPKPAQLEDSGSMSQHLRTDAAKALRRNLLLLGIKLPKVSAYGVAMCTHTAATMPGFFQGGKDKLKTFAVLGDASLVAVVAADVLSKGETCESMQSVRTTVLTDAHMSRAFALSPFARCVSVASGVSLTHSKTGATALEAIVGLVAFYRSPSDVAVLARSFKLL